MPQEAWGGEVQMPRWLRRIFQRPDPPGDTPERMHEARQPHDQPTVAQNADRAAMGPITQIYHEGRKKRH